MTGNWVRLSRDYLTDEIRKLGPEVSDTWIAILLAVNWKQGRFRSLIIHPGQMVFSWKNLAERLYPDFDNPPAINTLRTRLQRLEGIQAIRLEPTNKYTLLTVLDTSSVSGGVSKFDTQVDTQLDTQVDTDRRRVKKVIKKDQTEFDREFNSFWGIVTRKVGKDKAAAAYAKARKAHSADHIQRLAKAYYSQDVECQFLKHPATFLAQCLSDDPSEWNGSVMDDQPYVPKFKAVR